MHHYHHIINWTLPAGVNSVEILLNKVKCRPCVGQEAPASRYQLQGDNIIVKVRNIKLWTPITLAIKSTYIHVFMGTWTIFVSKVTQLNLRLPS